MKFHGRLYHLVARTFNDPLIPGWDDPLFSSHYLHVVFDDEKKNSYLICSNRRQIGRVNVQCDFQKRRDKVAHVCDLEHSCNFGAKVTDFGQRVAPPPVADPQQGIDELRNALIDFVGSTGTSISRAASPQMRDVLLTAIKIGQQYPDIDPQSLCVFPGRVTLTENFIDAQLAREKCVFRSYSKIGYCSLLMDGGKMHRSPYLCICISNPISTGLDPLIISVVKGFGGTIKDYQEVALDAFIKCKLHGVQIVGVVTDHLRPQVSALAHYSDQSVFKHYERLEANGLRFVGCACHKLNLAVEDFLNDPAAVVTAPIFGDISLQSNVTFETLVEDLKKSSEFLNSKSIQAHYKFPCPKFCPTRWTNLIDIAVFITRNVLVLLTIPIERPALFLDPTFAESYLRAIADAGPRIAVLFSGFQKLVHVFESDRTPAAYILCTLYKGYESSLNVARDSVHGNQGMVELLFRHIFMRFLNVQEGNLYRLLSLATPEGRLFYRTRFLAATNEFQQEPPSVSPLGLTVQIEEMTSRAIAFITEHSDEIRIKIDEIRNQLEGIRIAVADSESSSFASDAETEDDSETILQDESNHEEQGDEGGVDDQDSEAVPEGYLDEPDEMLMPEPPHASPCEFDMFNEESLHGVRQELNSLCLDLEINPDLLIPVWNVWIAGQFGMDIIGSFTHQSPIEVWERICSCSIFSPLLTIMKRLFAIPASQAVCERALWHLRRILLPSSVNTRPALALAKLQGVMSFDQSTDGKKVRTLKLCSIMTHKFYHFSVYPHETILDVKNMLEEQYGLSTQEILSSKPPRKVLDDDKLMGELDLSPIYYIRDK
jgi:hypothetical protein